MIIIPLTKSGKKVLSKFKKEYGENGKDVFYAMENEGKLSKKLFRKKVKK